MDKQRFLKDSTLALSEIYDMIENLNSINISDLNPKKTALIIIDVINGFVKKGALYSPRNEALIKPISSLSQKCGELDIVKIAFADTHSKDCLEFNNYPPHCIENTAECKVIDEIKGYILIQKNSTNGFLETKFQEWLKFNTEIDTFIIVGDCTDICISQFAITLKTYFNTNNIQSRLIVPAQLVNTFDGGLHNADLMHIIALFNMFNNGIELVKDISLL